MPACNCREAQILHFSGQLEFNLPAPPSDQSLPFPQGSIACTEKQKTPNNWAYPSGCIYVFSLTPQGCYPAGFVKNLRYYEVFVNYKSAQVHRSQTKSRK
jgi:hypothetical protein